MTGKFIGAPGLKAITSLAAVGLIGFSIYSFINLRNTDNVITPIRPIVQPETDTPLKPIKGVNVLYYDHQLSGEQLESYNSELIQRLTGLGTTHIAIAIPVFQQSDSNVVLATDDTPSVENVSKLIQAAHEKDVHVTVKPILDGRFNGYRRSYIEPADLSVWFNSYFTAIQPFVQLASETDAESFTIGVELSSIQDESRHWISLIANVRKIYRGDITYAANWDNPAVPFAKNLSYVGIDAYYPYNGALTNQELKAFWNDQIDALALDDPSNFVFHEYGIPSHTGAESAPYDTAQTGQPNEELQNKWLRASCDVITDRTAGGYIWAAYHGETIGESSVDDTSYDFVGKPSVEASIADCFSWY